ncbi:MAG: hypothetical protein F4185_05960 [Chloroflexi bacterium]|nr:hypothetical protein [Chloroflexota bacterium]
MNPRTGRIHTTYNQAGSATGRLASADPNLQNIPIRTPLGLRVREAFIAEQRPEWMLLSADYSQIDLRVLAHLSQDPALMAAFERGEDIHSSTASLIYGVPLDEANRDMRRLAKVMNFGVAYGLSAFGISQQTELTREEGAAFIEASFGTYPTVKAFLDDTVERAKADGYAETLLGRRRYIPELRSPHYPVRQAGERIALNMPVQGTSADVINEAMITIQRRLEGDGFGSRMLLQVHDELLFELPVEEEEELVAMLQDVMPNALEMSVPVQIDVKTGPTWASMTYAEYQTAAVSATEVARGRSLLRESGYLLLQHLHRGEVLLQQFVAALNVQLCEPRPGVRRIARRASYALTPETLRQGLSQRLQRNVRFLGQRLVLRLEREPHRPDQLR